MYAFRLLSLICLPCLGSCSPSKSPLVPRTHLEVRVTNEGGLPAQGVEVSVVPHERVMRLLESWPAEGQVEIWQWHEQQGTRATTDARGCARIPCGDGRLSVMAEGLGGFSYGTYDDSRGACLTMRLSQDHSVTVQVLDAKGKPATGVFVRLLDGSSDPRAAQEPGRIWTRATSGERGLVVLRHAQVYLGVERQRHMSYWFELSTPLPDRVRADIDPSALPREPIVLRLPETSRVTAEFPNASPIWVRIYEWRSGPEAFRNLGPGQPIPVPDDALVPAQGRASFAHVGCNFPIAIEAQFPGADRPVRQLASSPSRAGEGLVVRIVH